LEENRLCVFNIHQNITDYTLGTDKIKHTTIFKFELLDETPHHFLVGVFSNHNESVDDALSGEVNLHSYLALSKTSTSIEVTPRGYGDHLMIIIKSIQRMGMVRVKVSWEDRLSVIDEIIEEIESPFTIFMSVLVLIGITLTMISLGLIVWFLVLWKKEIKNIRLVEEK